MTITLRIQYKGDAARKLQADERDPGPADDPNYVADMRRALGLFQIPLPHNSRAIYKSGFVLCHWNITRDNQLFESILRGATRSQSIACKTTLDGLSISYIHLFENSKRIFFPNKNRTHSTGSADATEYEDSIQTSAGSTHSKPYEKHKYIPRALQADRSVNNNGSASSQNLDPGTSLSQATSAVHAQGEIKSTGSGASQHTLDHTGPKVTEDTLRRLAESRSLLALLTTTPRPEVAARVKREEESPQRLVPPNGPLEMSSTPMQKSPYGSIASSAPHASNDPYTLLTRRLPDTLQRYEQHSNSSPDGLPSRPQVHAHDRYPPSAPPSQYRRVFKQRSLSPTGPRGRSSDTRFGLSSAENPRYNGYYGHWQEADGQGHHNAFKRHSLNADIDKHGSLDFPSKGHKRPLSPASSRYGRSISPPNKRRSESGLNGSSVEGYDPRNWKYSGTSTYAKVDTDNRLQTSAGPADNKPWTPLSRRGPSAEHTPSIPVHSGTAAANHNGPTVGAQAGGARHPQAHALNRELWDIRRQMTALKAREDAIVKELHISHAPVLSEPSAAPKQPSLEDRLKTMEAEIQSLRDRLQRETTRRQLVEEACENERRRRKLAEDILDDTRRENTAPLVLPAMLDAFEKISQLTGDALMPGQEDMKMQ